LEDARSTSSSPRNGLSLRPHRSKVTSAWGVLTESGRPAAVSVLLRSRLKRAGIGIRVLSDVRVGDMTYPFSDCVLDARPDVRSAAALDELLGVTGAWDVWDLRDRRAGSPWLELSAGRAYVAEEPTGGVGILDTRVGVDEWWPTLPVNMRNSIRKARRRVEACGGSEIVVSTAAELPAAYGQFVALEASGWKGAEATSLSHRPAWRDLVWQGCHQRWGMVREPTYRLLAFNHRSVRGALVGAAWHARRLITRQGGWRVVGSVRLED